MRLEDHRDPPGVVRLGTGQPAQLGHRLPGAGYGADGLGPGLTAAERLDEVGGGDLGPLVVADERGPHQAALGVERYESVLLRGHADGLHALEEPAGGGLPEREQPGLRVDVDGLGFARVRGVSLPQYGTRVRVTDDDACELR